MTTTGLPTRSMATLALCALESCGGAADPSNGSPTDTSVAMPTHTFESTFSAIYVEVFPTGRCTLGLCHGEGASGGGLSLFPRETAYQNLVGAQATSVECSSLGWTLVVPGSSRSSLLYRKIDGAPPCGAPMPPHEPLEARQVDQVREWIERGAHDD